MQLTINVLFFVTGFALAIFASVRPKQTRKDLERLRKNVQYVFDALKLRPQHPLIGKSEIEDRTDFDHGAGSLFTTYRAQVEAKFDKDTWQRQVYEQLRAIILGQSDGRQTFPCVYATKGLNDNQHRYIFLHSGDPSEPRNIRVLGEGLRSYLHQARNIGRNTSLVVITPPEDNERSHDEYERQFWSTLRGLRIHDSKPWPESISAEVGSNKWAFCFDGSPVFPVALTPLYKKRHSRWAPSLCLAFQPKWVFDTLLSTESKRSGATDKVRKLLKEYDDIAPSPSLTAYGEPGTTEAHQLFLLDENEEEVQCPYDDFDAK